MHAPSSAVLFTPRLRGNGQLSSVNRAAAALGYTHGAGSRHLRSLREAAGFSLFDKAGTGLRLNTRGQAMQRAAAEALDGLEHEWARLLD